MRRYLYCPKCGNPLTAVVRLELEYFRAYIENGTVGWPESVDPTVNGERVVSLYCDACDNFVIESADATELDDFDIREAYAQDARDQADREE